MSTQFGMCNFDGKPVDPKELDRVRPVLAPYGPDGEGYICKDNFAVLYRAFHATKESRLEKQPFVSLSGDVITWDGRLDNREDLLDRLDRRSSGGESDLEIASYAYQRWETDAFPRLLGDWALSIFDSRTQSLILAKDFAGMRHLFYSIEREQVRWSTVLDPLVLFSEHSFALEEDYVAGWLGLLPTTNLTPYVGIHSVPASSYVFLRSQKHTVRKYWDFDPNKTVFYRSDDQYEQHFRCVFAESVRRRLRSDSPVIAELSGGMDSSAIVCVADRQIADGESQTPRLDTVSYYDDSEPNWNERPYFTKVEQKRGRAGWHIDAGVSHAIQLQTNSFAATPASGTGSDAIVAGLSACLRSQGNRVILSGFGGDEVTGGIPSAIPELEDLISQCNLASLASRLKLWALDKKKPWTHLLCEAGSRFLPASRNGRSAQLSSASWLNQDFFHRVRHALRGCEQRIHLFGPRPSFQENLITFEYLRRQLHCAAISSEPPYEKRYPYLDRDLVEFLYSVPREQIVRPGQRRSLFRRALAGIVPNEVLHRRRKAYVARAPLIALSDALSGLSAFEMVSESFGIIDSSALQKALQQAQEGRDVPLVPLLRTVGIERWLRNLVGLKPCPLIAARAVTAEVPAGSQTRLLEHDFTRVH